MLKRVGWAVNRLSCMSMPEIAYRAVTAARIRAEKAGWGRADAVPPADLARPSRPWVHVPPDVDVEAYRRAADAVLAGRLDVFSLDRAELGHPPQWNRDPRTGVTVRLEFGKTLNYRDPAQVGDIKYLWEPNRHLHLVTLAQAWRLTREHRYLDGIRSQLDSWFEQCPYALGANWNSSLELGLRLINWSLVWQLIGGLGSEAFAGDDGAAFRDRWLAAIYRHLHFIAGHKSRFSSANNHLLGELAGLFIGCLSWPCWPETEAWRDRAMRSLVREALTQSHEDGVSREQAVWYQHFVLDMLIACGLAGRANGAEFPPAYWRRIEALLAFLAAMLDVAGNMPMIGDADDGRVFSLDPAAAALPYRALLATGAVLFERGDFKAVAGAFDDKSRWLLGEEGARRFAALADAGVTAEWPRAFRHGGYYLLGDALGTPDEIRLTVDAGPLGYREIAAHGHADALAFTLSVGGSEILVDPGTFAYYGSDWRDYFRGTAAHNTVRIDGQDQSVSGGAFIWLRKARAGCLHWASSAGLDHFIGSHDGYTRLADPLTHFRDIRLHKAAGRIVVLDTLSCKREHMAELSWHFAEDCAVEIEGDSLRVTSGRQQVHMQLPPGAASIELRHGSENPRGGWVARRFDSKHPSPSVVATYRIDGKHSLQTEITVQRMPALITP